MVQHSYLSACGLLFTHPEIAVAMQPASASLSRLLRFARSEPLATLGFALVLVSLLLMAFGASLAPYAPERTVAGAILLPPNAAHWFGTDNVGFDIFSRVIAAPRIDIYIAVTSTFLALAIGVPLGVVTGYVGGERGVWGLLSEWTMRLLDVIQAFPVFILALALVAALGASQQNIVAVLVILQAPVFLRLNSRRRNGGEGQPVHRGGALCRRRHLGGDASPRAAKCCFAGADR